jgi:prolyl-tRNA synthetase
MKDLYTFDASENAALDTYADVQGAYRALFDELKLPYLVVRLFPMLIVVPYLTH